jgi:hypothetical protein
MHSVRDHLTQLAQIVQMLTVRAKSEQSALLSLNLRITRKGNRAMISSGVVGESVQDLPVD